MITSDHHMENRVKAPPYLDFFDRKSLPFSYILHPPQVWRNLRNTETIYIVILFHPELYLLGLSYREIKVNFITLSCRVIIFLRRHEKIVQCVCNIYIREFSSNFFSNTVLSMTKTSEMYHIEIEYLERCSTTSTVEVSSQNSPSKRNLY